MKTGVYSEFFTKSMVDLAQGQNLNHIITMLAEEIGQTVIVTDAVRRVLAFHEPSGIGLAVGEFFPLNIIRNDDGNYLWEASKFNQGRWKTELGSFDFIHFDIKVPNQIYGNCIILCNEEELNPEAIKIIQQASLTLLLALKDIMDKEAVWDWLLDEFTYDVLYNNYDSKVALYEKARRLRWNLEGPYAIIVIDGPKDKLSTVRRLGPAEFNSSPPIYTIVNDNVIIILSLVNLPDNKIKKALEEFTEKILGNLAFNHVENVHMGVGSQAANLTDLHQRFQEAKIAMELGKVFGPADISYFEEMGFLKFIFTAPAQELQEFAQRVLGKIIAYDLEMETDLLQTIEVYINQHCQTANCAKALYIHENTLRNRLKKIEELLNLDLKKIKHLLNIYIALQILKIEH